MSGCVNQSNPDVRLLCCVIHYLLVHLIHMFTFKKCDITHVRQQQFNDETWLLIRKTNIAQTLFLVFEMFFFLITHDLEGICLSGQIDGYTAHN